jgi:hypothetical protein
VTTVGRQKQKRAGTDMWEDRWMRVVAQWAKWTPGDGVTLYLCYSAGQSKSTILIAPELDFFRANGYRNRSQEG